MCRVSSVRRGAGVGRGPRGCKVFCQGECGPADIFNMEVASHCQYSLLRQGQPPPNDCPDLQSCLRNLFFRVLPGILPFTPPLSSTFPPFTQSFRHLINLTSLKLDPITLAYPIRRLKHRRAAPRAPRCIPGPVISLDSSHSPLPSFRFRFRTSTARRYAGRHGPYPSDLPRRRVRLPVPAVWESFSSGRKRDFKGEHRPYGP